MATRLGPSSVSYGIGVQNRYSAFLDEDDGFGPPAIHLPVSSGVRLASTDSKKNATLKLNTNPKINSKASNNKQQEIQQKPGQLINGQKSNAKLDVNKRQQQSKFGQQLNGPQHQRQMNNKHTASQNDVAINSSNKHSRGHQSNEAHHQSSQQLGIKENQQDGANQSGNGKSSSRGPRDQRYNNKNRQFNRDEVKRTIVGQDGGQASGTFGPSSDEEKRRRQQKRANDLRYKDPEKREARRNQSTNSANDEQTRLSAVENNDAEKSADNPGLVRGLRNRREGDRNENGGRGFRGGRGRGRRSQDGEEGGTANGERPGEGVPQDRRRNEGERPQRNRNGFGRGSGSRGSERGPRSEGGSKNQERQKPIPNFSDKSDFPSLAS